MKKMAALLMIFMISGITGCQNRIGSSQDEKPEEIHDEVIAESSANKDYDTIEDFMACNDETVFTINPQKMSRSATSSNAVRFAVIENQVTESESYVAVIYQCEADGKKFQIKLATYLSDNGSEQLDSVLSSNPDLFTEQGIAGTVVYYCPGSQYDWFNCYAMVIDEKMFVIDIEKGFDGYLEDILGSIVS